jgi:Eukaryotic aspartyl protease
MARYDCSGICSSHDDDDRHGWLELSDYGCGSTCSGHTAYNPNASRTANDPRKTFSLAYGDGSIVNGEQYTDAVSIAGLSV